MRPFPLTLVLALLAALPVTPAGAQPPEVGCTAPGATPVAALSHGAELILTDLDGGGRVVDERPLFRTMVWSPAGDLAYETTTTEHLTVVVRSAEGSVEHDLPALGRLVDWLDDDSLLLADDVTLQRMEATTGARTVLADLPAEAGTASIALGPGRDRVAVARQPSGLSPALWVVDLEGGARQLTERLPNLVVQDWTPDGSGVVASSEGTLLLAGLDGSRRTLLPALQDEDVVIDAVVHPDSRRVLVTASRAADVDGDDFVTLDEQWAATQLLSVTVAGGTAPALLTDLGADHAPVRVDVDDLGEQVRLTVDDQSSEPTVSSHWVMPLDNPSAARPITGSAQHIGAGSIAPTCADQLLRASGPTRVETAAAISVATFPSATHAVLARSDRPLDALLGGPLAGGAAPVLLTPPGTGLHPATAAELTRLGVTDAVVVGGAEGVSAQAAADLAAMGIAVDRIDSPDPYGLAAAVAQRLDPQRVLLVRGEAGDADDGWPDAVSAAGWASRDAHAILPTPVDALHPRTAQAIRDLDVPVTLIGGPAAISAQVEQSVADLGVPVDRIGGLTRLETSAMVADAVWPGVAETVWLATAGNWPDTLAVAPAAAAARSPTLLADPAGLPGTPIEDWLAARPDPLTQVRLAGGADVLPRLIGLQALRTLAVGS